MRALMFLAVLGLSACGEHQSNTNEAAADRRAEQQVLPTNDTTAIDAVSGEAANMAEDVNLLEDANAAANAGAAAN